MSRDTVDNLLSVFLVRSVLTTGLIALSFNSIAQVNADPPSVEAGFPDDFVTLYTQKYGSFRDTGGKGEGQTLGGFGGMKDKTRAENQAALRHVPVILLHGNGVHARHTKEVRTKMFIPIPIPTLGVWPIRDFLVNEMEDAYNDAEIWAISYLGSDPPPSEAELGPMVQNNLPDIRRFIDTVIEYLGVDKVDVIAHSLGNNMAKGYMNGFQNDNSWDNSKNRLDRIGTYVSLAAGHYGVGSPMPFLPPSDTDPGSTFEIGAHTFNSIADNTPYGALTTDQRSDNPEWIEQTSLDDEVATGGRDLIYYVAIRSNKDFVDEKNDESSRLVGAHVNQEFDFTKHGEFDPLNLVEHSRVITERSVFDTYAPCLNGGGPSCPEANGQCHTATNDQHVASERADKTGWWIFTGYRAKGSGDSLGSGGDDTTSLKETSEKYWEKVDSCPG